MDFMFDHLVPEAYRITHESGIVPGEQVRLYNEVVQRPSADRRDYYVSSQTGDDVTIVRYVDTREGEIESTVKASQLYATSVVMELASRVPAADSIGLRKNNIEIRARGLDPDIVVERQLDALAEASAILQKKGPVIYGKIFVRLALAETKAQFVCGFCHLAAVKSYLDLLRQVALERDVITIDGNDCVSLTEAGLARSKRALLPPQIKKYL